MSKTLEIRKLIKTINLYYYELLMFEIKETNLTVPQVLVLRCINEQPQTISSISESMMLSNSTVSGIIDRLEKNGYVIRVRDAEDRRVVWVTETKKLIELRGTLRALDENYSAFLLEDLDSNEIEQIEKSLQLLSKHMEKKINNYKDLNND